MSDIGVLLDEALPSLPAAEADWADVLARAGVRRRAPVGRRMVAVVLITLVATGAAFGSSSRLRALIGGRPAGIVLTSRFGSAGQVQLSARGLYIAHGRAIVVGRLRPVGRHRFFPRTVAVRWKVALGGKPSRVTIVVRGHTVATLCTPCSDGARGFVQLRPRVVQALFAGRGEAVLAQPHRTAPLRMER